MAAAKRKRPRSGPPAPALVRQGVYTAIGAALVAGAAALGWQALNPAPKVAAGAKGCGCGCSGGGTSTSKAYR